MRTITIVLFSLFLLTACIPATTAVPTTAIVQETNTSPAALATTVPPTTTEAATATPSPTATPAPEWGIAFAAIEPWALTDGPNRPMTLYVARPDGSDLRQLTGEIESIYGLTASPDGNSLLFSAFREDTSGDSQITRLDLAHLYIVNVQSGDIFTVTNGVESNEWKGGDWSPDGEYIAFFSEKVDAGSRQVPPTYALCTTRRDGADRLCFLEGPEIIWSVAWSPTGKQIAFVQYDDLWILTLDNRELLQVVAPSIDSHYAHLAWSPDGRRIAFAALGIGAEKKTDIFSVDSDGSDLLNLTKTSQQDFQPLWSPDGQHIVYISGDWATYVMDTNGNNATLVSYDSDLGSNAPIWSPDGSQLALIIGKSWLGNTHSFVTDWPSGDLHQLSELYVDDHLAWVVMPSY